MFTDREDLKQIMTDIQLLIRYAVPEAEQASAYDYVESFHRDRFALVIIKDFYRTLPDAREESLVKISMIEQKEQVFLLLLSTLNHHYLYLTNDEEGTFLGEYEDGIADGHILAFFEYPDLEAFGKAHKSVEAYREYLPLERLNENICPSCGVESGDIHTLGCPVELCPWCGGQLKHCNCRFDQLGVEELKDEAKLEELEGKLEAKGRIPYAKEQRPSFLKE